MTMPKLESLGWKLPLARASSGSSAKAVAFHALAGAHLAGELTGERGFDLLPGHARAEHRERVAQIDHLIDAAAEEIGGVAHRKTPGKRGPEGAKVGESVPGNCRKHILDQWVMELSGSTMEVPDTVLMKGLTTQDGALAAYGPGAAAVVTLDAWRKRVRVQQVAFTLAKVVAQHWQQEQGETIPMHRLFPQLLTYAQCFLAGKLDCKGNRAAQDVALNPYFQRAVGILFDALQEVDESGQNQERPFITPGPAGERSTRHVEFFTGRQPWPVQKCHLNAMVADTKTWEQSAATALDVHEAVVRWVKNDHLGFVVPYRKDGVRRRYLPDFIVELTNGERLIVEIKGQTGDAEVKAAAAHRWCNAVNNDGRFGRWSYHLVKQPPELARLLDSLAEQPVAA